MCGGTNLTKIFVNNGAEVTEVSQKEEESYAQEWFTRFVPSDKRQKAIDSYCFDKDGYSGYLWHVFSYKIMECVEGAEAKQAFNRVCKKDAVLLANWDDIVSSKIKNITSITAEMIDLVDDVILTDSEFQWTYVKTHEAGCGPYFYCPKT